MTIFKSYHPDNYHTWSRLEPRPRTVDFERTLKAEIRDPLWMLTRQWQWGEFKGEDTGSGVDAELHISNSRMTRFSRKEHPGNNNPDAFSNSNTSIPLETSIESLPVKLDIGMGIKMALRWKKMIAKSVTTGAISNANYYEDVFVGHASLVFEDHDESGVVAQAKFRSNRKLNQTYNAVSPHIFDGRRLYEHVKTQAVSNLYDATLLAQETQNDRDAVDALGVKFLAWVKSIYLEVPQSESAWDENHLEYRFATAIASGNTGADPEILKSDEYYHGRLDWYSFRHATSEGLDSSMTETLKATESATQTSLQICMLPGEVKFKGMPNDRWWELEDRQINFSQFDAELTDVGSVILAEFALVYGNEWSVIPYRVPVGSLSEVKSIVVTDNFGEKILVEPAGQSEGQGWEKWTMFSLSDEPSGGGSYDQRLFVPPVLHEVQEGPAIEEVSFIRDEMANMVWAVEKNIPDGLGDALNAHDDVRDYLFLLDPDQRSSTLDPLDKVFAQYVLATRVPENWIPFLPVKKDPDDPNNPEIVLRRGGMPRIIPGETMNQTIDSEKTVRPRSLLLNEIPIGSPYDVHEEEVPREGAIIKTSFQRTRWYDGTTYLWMGRRKTAGRGEGSSGLQFDNLEPYD